MDPIFLSFTFFPANHSVVHSLSDVTLSLPPEGEETQWTPLKSHLATATPVQVIRKNR